jgi:hypothetical protein
MDLHAHHKLHRAGPVALLLAAVLAGCGSGSKQPSSTRAAGAPPSPTTNTATSTTPSATHHATSKRGGGKGTTTSRSDTRTGATRSTSTPAPTPLHPDTAATGGCPQGTAPCVSKSTSVKAVGPYRIDANLVQALARNQPAIKQAVVICPASKSYPVSCKLTGEAPVHGKVVPIKGTITVIGVEVRTRTYAYETEYAPAYGG